MNTKIIVCCHKECPLPQSDIYMPIQVGKAISNVNLGIQGDDTGDNISHKNASYCELTGMYWAWKNLKGIDIIGLCHYRRFFDFHNQCAKVLPYTEFDQNNIWNINLNVPGSFLEEIANGKVIVPNYLHYWQTMKQDFCQCHISDDYRTMTRIVYENQNKSVVDAYDKIMHKSNKLMSSNMFLMRWDDFDLYCSWLFDLLAKIESETDISNYNTVQGRIFGYMAERLFNVWLLSENKKTIHRPVIWFVDQPSSPPNWILYFLRNFFWDTVNHINVFSRNLSSARDY